MEQVIIGILDEDKIYRKRLMEYLNHQSDYPMKAISFANKEQVEAYLETNYLAGIISGEKMDFSKNVLWIPLGNGEGNSLNKYGNAAVIARDIYNKMDVTREVNASCIGVYSPFLSKERTKLSLELAGKIKGIYFGMEEIKSLDFDSSNMDTLLFYIKERRDDIISYLRSNALDFHVCYGFASALCYVDYKELTYEDFRWFLKKVKEENQCMVVDIGTASLYDLGILSLFDKVYVPVSKSQQESKVYENFHRLVHTIPELQTVQIEEVWVKANEDMKDLVKRI